MNFKLLPLLVPVLLVGLAPRAHAAPTLEDIRQLVQNGQIPEALQKISAALSAPRGAHRYELYMLKGECHLQTKATTLASESYTKASKETQELEPRSLALAHAALIKKSAALVYRAKFGEHKGQTFDITKPEPRKQAFAALLADEQAVNKQKIKQAEGAKGLAPILEIVDDVVVMEGMEIAARGKPEETQETLKVILARAKDLISDTLKELSREVTRIEKQANTYREFTQDEIDNRLRVRRVTVWQKNGVDRPTMKYLQDIGHTCDQIGPAARVLGEGIKQEQKDLEALVDNALKIRRQITQILDEDYTQILRTKPKQ